MSQQSQGMSSFSPADPPAKRKRGRPRKDDSHVQAENTPVMSGSDNVKKNKQIVGASDAVTDDMVGMAVSGVIEGSFDAGYLLNVKVGDTDTQLRGVVFLPGRFTPITAANDVAPNAKMYKRKEIPIPVVNPQTEHCPIIPQSEQIKKQAAESKTDEPKLPYQVQPSELQSGIPFASENQSASVTIPIADNFPMNATDQGEKVVLRQTSESALESQTASIIAQLKQDKAVGQDKLQQRTNMDIEVTKESEPAAAPFVDIVQCTENVNQGAQVEHQALSSDLKSNDLVRDESKNLNIEGNQTTVFAEPEPVPSEPIGISILMQKENLERNQTPLFAEPESMSSEPIGINNILNEQNLPKKDTPQDPPQDPQLELGDKDIGGYNTSLSVGVELGNKDIGGYNTSLPVSEAANITAVDSYSSPITSLSVMMFDGEAIPSEPKLETEGCVLPRMIENEICNTSAATSGTDSEIKETITNTKLDLFSGVNLSGSG